MTAKRAIAITLLISIITITFVVSVQGASATNDKVVVKFAVSGLTNYSSNIITIDGATFTVSDLGWRTFEWKIGSTHRITAYSIVKNTAESPNRNYTFTSWTNGNGLTTNSGTFTVPSCGVTVTANYTLATHLATFAVNGLTSYSGNILTIDGVACTVSDLGWKVFPWDAGTTHTIAAVTPIHNTESPSKTYAFQSWSSGSGLVGSSGTITMPNSDISITATYGSPTHVARFSVNGLTDYTGNIIKIDGITYTVSDLGTKTFAWDAGTTHNIQAITPIQNTRSPAQTFVFQSWINGGSGLTGESGTITMPNGDLTVAANYASITYNVTFAINGLSGYSGSILKIDGVTHTVSDLGWKIFAWNAGTTHTIEAVTPAVNTAYPAETFNFSSWTNGGSGLSGKSGTFTVSSQNQQITISYIKASAQVTFATSGLGNIPSSQTVLTVDGHAYNKDQVSGINSNLDWMMTSTHTVTAANELTDWNGVKYIFQGWTNGNGLTTNTGTLTVPNGDAVVTANYAAAATPTVTPTPTPTTPTEPSTTLTVSVVDSTADRGAPITISGALTSGSCGLQYKTITLSYFDGASWCIIGQTTTGCGGAYSYSWTIPQSVVNGQYPLKAEFAGDCSYQGTSAMTGTLGNGGSLFVVPEVGGALGALGACIGSTLVYGKLRSKRGGKT